MSIGSTCGSGQPHRLLHVRRRASATHHCCVRGVVELCCALDRLKTSFNDLPWHDAVLRGIVINRRQPGASDQIRLEVTWLDGASDAVVFTQCYYSEMSLNFGVVAEETIRHATENSEDPFLHSLRQTWNELNVSLDRLTCFRFETNSTGSRICICATGWEHADGANARGKR